MSTLQKPKFKKLNQSHADMFVELGGNRYLYASGTFQKLDVATALAPGSGNYVAVSPTFGGAIK